MAHVITQNCCNDAACVPVCPVDCIHPAPHEDGYRTAEMLYIDPDACTDCGLCKEACPVDAIYIEDSLPAHLSVYKEINAKHFDRVVRDVVTEAVPEDPRQQRYWKSGEPLRVAIVGAGPSGFYAAEELLTQTGLRVHVDMFDKLPIPGGLVRFGVAPDHGHTKRILETFRHTMRRVGFRLIGNVEIGKDLSHETLAEHYHAVLYSVGAMADRSLDIPGEGLAGSHSATEFVAWYNGHPDYAGYDFDLSGERAVIIGNGNVAMDIARILLASDETLRQTDIAAHALEKLAKSSIKEVVVVGRRGPAEASFSTPELLGLMSLDDVDIVVPVEDFPATPDMPDDSAVDKQSLLARLSVKPSARTDKRIVLRFLHSPVEVLGEERMTGIRLERNELVEDGGKVVARPTGTIEDIGCGLMFRSVGYRGRPINGLPFDEWKGTLPHLKGRVLDPSSSKDLGGVYVAGWIKRGPSGVIGTNKQCAHETVTALLDDFAAGALKTPAPNKDILSVVDGSTDLSGWFAINDQEIEYGRQVSRPRVKIVDTAELLEIARHCVV